MLDRRRRVRRRGRLVGSSRLKAVLGLGGMVPLALLGMVVPE